MQSRDTNKFRQGLARSAAVVLVGGLAAGCSSDVTRFSDGILTGSTRPSQPVAVAQTYPGDAAVIDQTTTGSVARNAVRPVSVWSRLTSVLPGSQQATQPVAQPMPVQQAQNTYQLFPPPGNSSVVAAATNLDRTVTGSVERATSQVQSAIPTPSMAPSLGQLPAPAQNAATALSERAGGWTRAGGTQVTTKPGETVFNLSRRYGVPADTILKANGLAAGSTLAAGQQILIPTYIHAASAPVSAPNANVADARSSTGTQPDGSSGKVPLPTQAPSDRLAVLPQQPKVREQQPGAQTASADARPSQAPSGATYTVTSGDTLNGVARKTGVSPQALKDANGLSNGVIRIGQVLKVPAGGAAPVQTVAAKQPDPIKTAAIPQPKQATSNAVQQASLTPSEAAPDATGISRMRWPVRGRVISNFGAKNAGKANDGIDIAVPAGTPVKAAENGVVIYAGDGLKEFGNTVLVRHENGLVTVYGHASEINVKRGQQVRRGEEIAKAGMSGSADTPKLHFEVRKESAPVNPSSYLE